MEKNNYTFYYLWIMFFINVRMRIGSFLAGRIRDIFHPDPKRNLGWQIVKCKAEDSKKSFSLDNINNKAFSISLKLLLIMLNLAQKKHQLSC